jgi:hypothetical protein
MIYLRPGDGHTITTHVEKDYINNTNFLRKTPQTDVIDLRYSSKNVLLG